MATLKLAQNMFASGEMSPETILRTDIDKYYRGCRKLQNFIVQKTGGVSRRCGFRYVDSFEYNSDTNPVRLFSFEYSDTDVALLVFTLNTMRVYRNDVLVSTITSYAITEGFIRNFYPCQVGNRVYVATGEKPVEIFRELDGTTEKWIITAYNYADGPFAGDKHEGYLYGGNAYIPGVVPFTRFQVIATPTRVFRYGDIGDGISINYDVQRDKIETKDQYTAKIVDNVIPGDPPITLSELNKVLYVGGSVSLYTMGTWDGTITLQFSKDNVNFTDYQTFTSIDNNNFDWTSDFTDNIGFLRVRVSKDEGQGGLYLRITSSDFHVIENTRLLRAADLPSSEINAAKVAGTLDDLKCYAFQIETTPGLEYFVGDIGYNKPFNLDIWSATPTYNFYVDNSSAPHTPGDIFYYIERPGGRTSVGALPYQFSSEYDERKLTADFNFNFVDTQAEYPQTPISVRKVMANFTIKCKLVNEGVAGETISLPKVSIKLGTEVIKTVEIRNETTTVGFYIDKDTGDDKLLTVSIDCGMTIVNGVKKSFDVLVYDWELEYATKTDDISRLGNKFSPRITFNLNRWESGNEKYPTSVCLYQNRLVFGGGRYWAATRTNDYYSFKVDSVIKDTDGISSEIMEQKSVKIQSIYGADKLILFTTDGEYISLPEVLTSSDYSVKKDGFIGSANIPPIGHYFRVVYITNDRHTIRDLGYNYESDGYSGEDLTVLSKHLFETEITELAYSESPEFLVYALTKNGTVNVLAYDRQVKLAAWSRIEHAPRVYDDNGETKTEEYKIRSMAALRRGNRHSLYVVAQKGNRIMIERIDNTELDYKFTDTDGLPQPFYSREYFYVDSGISPAHTTDNTQVPKSTEHTFSALFPNTYITALDYNGNVIRTITDGNGNYTTSYPTWILAVGLAYDAVLETLPINFVMQGSETTQGSLKRVIDVRLFYLNSRGGKIRIGDNSEEEFVQQDADSVGQVNELQNGSYFIPVNDTHEIEQGVMITHSDPLPLNITNVITTVDIGGR